MSVVCLPPLCLALLLVPPCSAAPPPPPLRLPVFVDSPRPLLEKRYFSPVRGTGFEPLPTRVRDVLLPVARTNNGTARPGSGSEPAETVSTWCEPDKMRVRVERSVLGRDENQFVLTLGACPASRSTGEHLYFEYDVSRCGTKRMVIDDQVVYANTLRFDPPARHDLIRRAAPFTLPVACYFNRYQYSYKVGYTPKVQLNKVFKPMKGSASFVLTPRNARWERLSPSDPYALGRPMYFQAETAPIAPGDRLYVHACYATPQAAHESTPRFTVVTNFGCMAESKDGRSRFLPPHSNHVVRFAVDAFLFSGVTGQRLYMHCSMSVGRSAPTLTAKACNYDAKNKRWAELYGNDSVCDCCDSTCRSAASAVSEVVSSRSWTIQIRSRPADPPKKKGAEFSTTGAPIRTPPPPEARSSAERWPYGHGGVTWVEEGEDWTKGSAEWGVEEEAKLEEKEAEQEKKEAELSEPHRVFEDVFDFD